MKRHLVTRSKSSLISQLPLEQDHFLDKSCWEKWSNTELVCNKLGKGSIKNKKYVKINLRSSFKN